jgi:hypothetical protein
MSSSPSPPTSCWIANASPTTTSASANSPIVATGMLIPPDRGRGPRAPALVGRFGRCSCCGRGRCPGLGVREAGSVAALAGVPGAAAAAAPAAAAPRWGACGTPSPRYTGQVTWLAPRQCFSWCGVAIRVGFGRRKHLCASVAYVACESASSASPRYGQTAEYSSWVTLAPVPGRSCHQFAWY